MKAWGECKAAVLLVEDTRQIAESIGEYLETFGHSVDYAVDGASGLRLATHNHYDVIVLDVMLPGMDGITLCQRLRAAGQKTPILMLTGRNTVDDRIEGLDAGADDYLAKPFALRELGARIQALIRRERQEVVSGVLKVGDLAFDTATLEVRRAGKLLELTPIGLKILALLMRESPRYVSRRDIERAVWGEALPDSDSLRSHMYNVRNAIDKSFDPSLLHTLHSRGYRLFDATAHAESVV
jgi:DNA-binding response OmpR family regulator